jgi:hypothetical protein
MRADAITYAVTALIIGSQNLTTTSLLETVYYPLRWIPRSHRP